MFLGFVHRKSRRVRRNLEQDPTGLAKVNRVKIDPVDDWGHVVSAADEIVSPCQLLLVAWRAKKITREEAVNEIVSRYEEFVNIFEEKALAA